MTQKKRKMIKSGSGSIKKVNSSELVTTQQLRQLPTQSSTNSTKVFLYRMTIRAQLLSVKRKLIPKITGSETMV